MTKVLELLTSIKDNKYTTIIGAIAIAYGVFEIINDEGDNKWGIGLVIIGAGLLFSKDGTKKESVNENKVNPEIKSSKFVQNHQKTVQWGGFQNPNEIDCQHPECPKKY